MMYKVILLTDENNDTEVMDGYTANLSSNQISLPTQD